MTSNPAFLKNSIIVAAHPDDELLWFNSILENVQQVVLVYEDYWPNPSMKIARQRALETHPHPNISSLKIQEAATYGCANWANPELSDYGMKFGHKVKLRDLKQKGKRLIGKSLAPKVGISQHYRENFATISRKLGSILTSDMNVFTHNPWGEYGHEDHVQLFRILDKLRSEIGFTLWMSNYCTDRSLPLAMTYFNDAENKLIELETNRTYANKVADIYRKAGCWTWKDDWNWFPTETFMEAPSVQTSKGPQEHLFALNLFNVN